MIIYVLNLDVSCPFSFIYDRPNTESQTKNILRIFLTEPNLKKKDKCSYCKRFRFEVQKQIVTLIKSKSMHKFSHVILFEHYAQVALLSYQPCLLLHTKLDHLRRRISISRQMGLNKILQTSKYIKGYNTVENLNFAKIQI